MTASPNDHPDRVSRRGVYAAVLGAVLLATVVRWALGPVIGEFVTYFVAIVFAAWRGGLYPALLATVLGFVLTLGLFPSAQFAGTGLSRRRVLGWILYFVVCGAIAVFGEAMWRARRRLQGREEALQQQTALLRAITDGTPDLVYVKDTDGRLRFANPATLDVMGLGADTAIGADPARLFRSDAERDATLATDRRILAAAATDVVEEAYTGVRGPRTYLSTKSPMRDDSGAVVGLIGIGRDITERRRVEERLLESEARFRLLADSMPQIVYVTEADGRVTFVNQQWRDYTGQSNAQQADLGPLVHPDDLPRMFEAWRTAATSGTPFSSEFRLRRAADGAYRWFLTRSVPVVEDDGRIVRWYGTSTDIHRHKLAEERMRAGEARQAFLVTLGDALRPLRGPVEVQAVASEVLGRALGASRVLYFETRGHGFRVMRDYTDGVPSLAGEYPAAAFSPHLMARSQRGQISCEDDVQQAQSLPADERAALVAAGIRALVAVPLIKDGVLAAGLAVHHPQARAWTPDEIALVQDAAERTWAAVERARVEAALVESEARFRALFDTMDEGFCIVDMLFDEDGRAVDYRIVEMNPAFERHTGLRGVQGRTARDFAPTLEEFWFETYGRVATTGESIRFVHQAQPLGARWFDVYAFRLDGDGGAKVAILFTDITARALSDQAASLRSEQVRRLAAVLPRISASSDITSIMGVVTVEARRLIDAHQSSATFVNGGDWAGAITVTSVSDKYVASPELDRQFTEPAIQALVCTDNTPVRLTAAEFNAHPAFSRAGDRPRNGWLGAPLVARDGRNMGLLQLADKAEGAFTPDDEAVLMQVAQMAAVAIDNARLVDDLQVADRRKDEFLSVLAHELRNPLAPIRSGLHLMKVAHHDARIVGRAREIMERQIAQMVRLIDDLMDLTRISRGKLLVQKRRVALDDVLRIAVETSQPLIEQAGHAFTLDVPADAVFVEADETRLAQVFANLLNNAAKYTPQGGRVGLSVERCGDQVQIAVADNGVGIPPAMLGQVFDMFTQVDRSLEQAQGGLGIGLNIARRLVEKHGGRIEAESGGEGCGSRFVVRLPLAGDGAAAAAATGTMSPASPRRRVLVVDDNADAATSLSLMLESMGHETRTAQDGREALVVAADFRPELVLMDIGMPILNGYDACRQLREQSWGRAMRIVACTGWGQDEDRQRSKDAGFDQHMVKPPSPSTLEQLIAALPAAAPYAGPQAIDGAIG